MAEQPTVSLARAIGRPALENPDESRRVERLPGVHLELKVGNTLSMRFAAIEQKYEGKVVGLEPFSYLIVQARLPLEAVSRIAANGNLVAQHSASGVVYGFRSAVLNRVTNPAPLYFLSFPDTVERVVLRRDERVSVSVPGSIHGKYGDHDIMLVDLTTSGCRISAKIDMKSPLRTAQAGEQVILSCDLGRGQVLMTPIVLRRVEEQKGLVYLGAQFVDMAKETSQMVQGYVHGMLKFMRA